MAKTIVDPRAVALATLAGAVADLTPRVLLGTAAAPGFFKGSAKAVKDAAQAAVDNSWLEPTGDAIGTGARKKPLYRLTAAGIHAVLEGSETLQLLRGLGDSVRQQVDLLQTIHAQLGRLADQAGPLSTAVAALERRLQPPPLAAAPARPGTAWLDRVVPLAQQQRERDRFQPLDLSTLWEQIRRDCPDLTLGQFHDGLRALRDQGRIRLLPFTRALASIGDPRNALYLDGEVMYYVELP
jgi:hypothetical protein